jgi:hypothetical protein
MTRSMPRVSRFLMLICLGKVSGIETIENWSLKISHLSFHQYWHDADLDSHFPGAVEGKRGLRGSFLSNGPQGGSAACHGKLIKIKARLTNRQS